MHVAAARSRRRTVVIQRLVKVKKAAVWRTKGSKKQFVYSNEAYGQVQTVQ